MTTDWETLYNDQCRVTDEWAAKYREEREKKADIALLARIDELETALEEVNQRLTEANSRQDWSAATIEAAYRSLQADMVWLGQYLLEKYSIGKSDGWRICIGGGGGATWTEAVRAGRQLHERAEAARLAREQENGITRGH